MSAEIPISPPLGIFAIEHLQLDAACTQPSLFLSCEGKPRSLASAGIPLSGANIPKGASVGPRPPHSAAREGKIEAQGDRIRLNPQIQHPWPLVSRYTAAESDGQPGHWLPCPELGSAFLYN